MRRWLGFGVVASLLAGCGGARSTRPAWGLEFAAERSFRFELQHSVETELDRVPEGLADEDRAALEVAFAPWELELGGRLQRTRVRTFDDGTAGVVLSLAELNGSIGGDAEAAAPLSDALDGRSIAVRLWPTGELLDATGWRHLAGIPGDGLSLASLFHMSLTRLPPVFSEEPAEVRYRIASPVTELAGWEENWVTRWTWHETVECGSSRCERLSFSSTFELAGGDGTPGQRTRVAATGTAEGELWFDPGADELHQMSWTLTRERQVDGFDGDPDGPAARPRAGLIQRERVTGELAWQR